MLSISGHKQAFCDGLNRREFVRVGALGLGGVTLADLLRLEGFLARNSHPSQRLDPETDPEAKAVTAGVNPHFFGGR